MQSCKICKVDKPIDHFIKQQCRECRSRATFQQKHSSIDPFLKVLLQNAKETIKKMNEKERSNDESPLSILTFDELKTKVAEQDGRCYFSGLCMNIDKDKWRMALSRIDKSKGYTPENSVLCCNELNKESKWSTDKIDFMLTRLERQNDILLYKFDIESHKKYKVDGLERFQSPRTNLQRLISNAVSVTKKREKTKPLVGDFELSVDIVAKIYNEQGGRCAYSKMPLLFDTSKKPESDWLCSLERKDLAKGFTKENTCLVCEEFSTYDFSARYEKQNNMGVSPNKWSAEKFLELYTSALEKRSRG